VGLLPVEGLVEKLGCRPILFEPVISQIANSVFDRASHLGYNDVTNPLLIQGFDKFVVEETRIGSDSDPINAWWNFHQTFFEELRGTK
jgi:hypothetical protein